MWTVPRVEDDPLLRIVLLYQQWNAYQDLETLAEGGSMTHRATRTCCICIDLETSGLNLEVDRILEIGMVAFDEDLEAIDTFSTMINSQAVQNRLHELQAEAIGGDENAQRVIAMHTENGLLPALRAKKGVPLDVATTQAIAWLGKVGGVGLPITGSNAPFDRKFLNRYMPSLEKKFHYRNIDVSSIKEWLKAYAPELYAEIDSRRLKEPIKLHRTISDCMDTRDELRRYNEALL